MTKDIWRREMRDKLAPYLSEYVLCKGWIDNWEKLEDGKNRVLIKSPVIKEPNKNVMFDDLKLISKEHHINLFLEPKEVKGGLQRLEEIYFTGNINRYTRSDGTRDYGIHPTPYSSLHNEMDAVYEDLVNALNDDPRLFITHDNLMKFEFIHKPRVLKIENDLEKSGNKLPTFFDTYQGYKSQIKNVKEELFLAIKWIRGMCSNRKSRRTYGIAENFALRVPSYEDYIKDEEKKERLKIVNSDVL